MVGGHITNFSGQNGASVYQATFTPTSGFNGQASIAVADGSYTDQYGVAGAGSQVTFAGDTVEFGATPYCGDAHFTDWPGTIRKLRELGAEKMVPGRGRALLNALDTPRANRQLAGYTLHDTADRYMTIARKFVQLQVSA